MGHRTHGSVLLFLPSASAPEDMRTVQTSLHWVEQLRAAASKQFLHLSAMVAVLEASSVGHGLSGRAAVRLGPWW